MSGSGWLSPILISIGMIAVLTAMEMLSLAISEKMARGFGSSS